MLAKAGLSLARCCLYSLSQSPAPSTVPYEYPVTTLLLYDSHYIHAMPGDELISDTPMVVLLSLALAAVYSPTGR